MSIEDLEPLPEDLELLLRQGRPGVEPPPAARDAVLSFVAAHAITTAAGAVAHGAAGAGRAGGTTAVKTWGAIKGSFGLGGVVLGVALGAGGHAALVAREERVPVLPVASSVALTTKSHPTTTAADAGDWTTVEPIVVASAAPVHAAPPTEDEKKTGRDSELRAERALIDTAQTAVARRDPDAALTTLARHAREFPHGQLAEEREWLTIQALILTGRSDDARARATAFRRAFPQSLMLPALDRTLPADVPVGH
jgi:hypothetical protein